MQKWTQEEAINYESAREIVTDLIAIYTAQINEENAKAYPDAGRIAWLEREIARVFRERANLRVFDHAGVAHIRTEYGAQVRAWRAGHQTEAGASA